MYITDLNAIGKRLTAYRKNHGLTQAQAAEASNLSLRNYAAHERGESGIQLLTLIQICNGLQIPIEDLLINEVYQEDYKTEINNILESCTQTDLRNISHLISYWRYLHK